MKTNGTIRVLLLPAKELNKHIAHGSWIVCLVDSQSTVNGITVIP